ncbi:hypothetical protein D6D18_10056 [Aureobasidium pullulans]|nr:hypothetical protein D6D18_10056 [Aureobasidium pullulans]
MGNSLSMSRVGNLADDEGIFDNPLLSDVVVKFGPYSIKAHKSNLSQGSKYFLKAFTSGLKETYSNEIVLKGNDDPKAVLALLRHIYGLSYDHESTSNTETPDLPFHAATFAVADKYDVPKLRDAVVGNAQRLLMRSETLLNCDPVEMIKAFDIVFAGTPADSRLQKLLERHWQKKLPEILKSHQRRARPGHVQMQPLY